MDNVVGYDVVLRNGSRVVANVTSNPDLFWALKGGANNFGVVTRFTLRTYQIPLVSNTIQNFDEASILAFIEATVGLARSENASIRFGSIITIGHNVTTGATTATLLGVQEGS